MRSDYPEKDGDGVQVREYASRLRELGFAVDLVPFALDIDLTQYDIIHAVNVDRMFDFLWTVERAKGKAIFVSPIHHDFERVARMRAAGSRRPRLPESVREAGALLWRARTGASLGALLRTSVWLSRIAWRARPLVGIALDSAEAVFTLTAGVGEGLTRDFGWKRRNGVLTPNGIPDAVRDQPTWSEREGILVVGRIEPRKRSLDLVRAGT